MNWRDVQEITVTTVVVLCVAAVMLTIILAVWKGLGLISCQ